MNNIKNSIKYKITRSKDSEYLYERSRAFREMQNQRINGLPLFQRWQPEEENYEQIIQSIVQSSPKAITVGWVRHSYRPVGPPFYNVEPGSIIMIPSYQKGKGREYVNSVLRSYYQGREIPGQTEFQRLGAIAEATRNLHVIHSKRDANSRTNIFGWMNKCLIEEGFSPTILPNGKIVFGGAKTRDGLVEDIVDGMHLFMEAVNEAKKTPSVQ